MTHPKWCTWGGEEHAPLPSPAVLGRAFSAQALAMSIPKAGLWVWPIAAPGTQTGSPSWLGSPTVRTAFFRMHVVGWQTTARVNPLLLRSLTGRERAGLQQDRHFMAADLRTRGRSTPSSITAAINPERTSEAIVKGPWTRLQPDSVIQDPQGGMCRNV